MTCNDRCKRCNSPHYTMNAANKHGGYGRILEPVNGRCAVCHNLLVEQLGNLHLSQPEGKNSTLADYE